MNRRLTYILAACALLAAPAASAETLPVGGVYPAANDAAAKLRIITIEPFGGADGQTVALLVADRLRAIQIDEQPYFRIVPAGGAVRADAVLQGSAAAELSRRDAEPREKEICVDRNDKDKCVRKEKHKIPCWDAVARLVTTIRLVRPNGDRSLLWMSLWSRTGDIVAEKTGLRGKASFASSQRA